jgi:hypothetical protein
MGWWTHDRFAIRYPGNADVEKAAKGGSEDEYDHH